MLVFYVVCYQFWYVYHDVIALWCLAGMAVTCIQIGIQQCFSTGLQVHAWFVVLLVSFCAYMYT